MMRLMVWCAIVAMAVLAACVGLSPEENQRLAEITGEIARISQQIAEGGVDPELARRLAELTAEADALRRVAESGGIDWTQVIGYVATAAATFFGIELRRGSPMNRKGLPPKPA